MRFRGDDHSRFFWRRDSQLRGDHDPSHELEGHDAAPGMAAASGWDGDPEAESAAESELVRRLRTMEWPKPPPGVKERCLRDLMTKIDEMRLSEQWPMDAAPATNGNEPNQGSGRNLGEIHPLTRRIAPHGRMTPAGQRVQSAYRPPLRSLRAGIGSVRMASIL